LRAWKQILRAHLVSGAVSEAAGTVFFLNSAPKSWDRGLNVRPAGDALRAVQCRKASGSRRQQRVSHVVTLVHQSVILTVLCDHVRSLPAPVCFLSTPRPPAARCPSLSQSSAEAPALPPTATTRPPDQDNEMASLPPGGADSDQVSPPSPLESSVPFIRPVHAAPPLSVGSSSLGLAAFLLGAAARSVLLLRGWALPPPRLDLDRRRLFSCPCLVLKPN
jgi:hypothetical protein